MEHPQLRKIIHIDMDAFFASVEQLDNPALKGMPVAVGGTTKRGVVAAASYEARKFGVRSAMSTRRAQRLCPQLVMVEPRFERYREISGCIQEVFHQYTDLVEPLSLDEAYLDVTRNKIGIPSATVIASDIRRKILDLTGLTASAGISVNKFLAKIASDFHKPNGQKTIAPDEIDPFLEALEIRNFHGVGKVTAEKMYRLGIFTGTDLKSKSLGFLVDQFGSSGKYFYEVVRGNHYSEVLPSRHRKSLSAELTFEDNISSEVFMAERLKKIAGDLEKRLLKHQNSGRTVTLKIRYSDFSTHTRSRTLPHFVSSGNQIYDTALDLLYQEEIRDSVRLLGITLSNLNISESQDRKDTGSQLTLVF